MKRRAVSTQEELELETEESQELAFPRPQPPIWGYTFLYLCFVFLLFLFSIYPLSRSNLQTSCLNTLVGMAQSLSFLWTLDACLVMLQPKRSSSSQEKNIQPCLAHGQVPIFCLMREDWNYLVLLWKGLNSEAIFGKKKVSKIELEINLNICPQCCDLNTVFQCWRNLRKTSITTADKFTYRALVKTGHIKRDTCCMCELFTQ